MIILIVYMEKRTSRYEHLLWDIDGTLTDPAVGITTATQLALRRCGIEVEDRLSLCKFIGPPLMDSFRDFYGFTDVQAARACGYFREYYNVRGLFENVMYDGIDRLLDRLTEAGYKLYVATSKPDPIARQVLEHFDLARRFLFIGADTPEHLRPNKAAVVRYVIQSNHLEGELERTVMIGDRKHDVMGARAAGIDCIGVLYGYGSAEEMREYGATATAQDVASLGRLLLGN